MSYSIQLSQSSCSTQPTKETPNTSRPARLQGGKARSLVANMSSTPIFWIEEREKEANQTPCLLQRALEASSSGFRKEKENSLHFHNYKLNNQVREKEMKDSILLLSFNTSVLWKKTQTKQWNKSEIYV